MTPSHSLAAAATGRGAGRSGAWPVVRLSSRRPDTGTRAHDLSGRIFLHDFDWRIDDNFNTLGFIITAPVVVASWISLQYYGSTVAPDAFGAGNKLLHNVVGGFGVVEGNGGRGPCGDSLAVAA